MAAAEVAEFAGVLDVVAREVAPEGEGGVGEAVQRGEESLQVGGCDARVVVADFVCGGGGVLGDDEAGLGGVGAEVVGFGCLVCLWGGGGASY